MKKSLLRKSAKPPGRLGTVEEFGRCGATGKYLLFDELERCAASKKVVDRDLLVTCGVTRERIQRSGTFQCAWLGQPVDRRLEGACSLTRLIVSARHLDENGMLRPLSAMLDGRLPKEAAERNDLAPRLRTLDPKLFSNVNAIYAVPAPTGDLLAVCVALTEKGWFTSRMRHAGFLLDFAGDPHILGDCGPREWELARKIPFG